MIQNRGQTWRLGPRFRRVTMPALIITALLSACGSQRSVDEFAAVHASDIGTSGALAVHENAGTAEAAGDDDPSAAQIGSTDAITLGGDAPGTGDAREAGSTDNSPAGPASGPESQNSAQGAAAGKPIRIGSIGTLSGPIGAAIGNGAPAVQAWAAYINSQGGIDGHPVEVFVADDGGDPARHRAIVQDMVEDKGVVAFVHNASALSGHSAVSYLEGKRVPVLGSEAGSPWMNSSPMFFPQQASDARLALSFADGYATIARDLGLSKIALLSCAEIQGCQTSTQGGPFRDAGLNVVYEARASLAQPSYTSQCLSARDKGAEIVVIGLDAQSAQRVADNCKSVGYTPKFGIVPQAVTLALASKSTFAGALVVLQTAPWFQTSIPGVAEFQQAMSTLAPGVEQNGSSIQGWTSAKMFEAAARNTGNPTTSAGILEGLYKLSGDDLGGLTYPLTFTEGAANNAGASPPCWWDVRIDGGKFVSPDGGKRHCP